MEEKDCVQESADDSDQNHHFRLSHPMRCKLLHSLKAQDGN